MKNIKIPKGSNFLIFNIIITIILGMLTFVINKYFSLVMGKYNLGLMRLFNQLVAFLSIVDLGVGAAAIHRLYKPFYCNEINEINKIISTVDNLFKKISILVFSLGFLLTLVLPLIIEMKFINYFYWGIYILNVSYTYIFAKYSIIFTADQNYKKVRIVQSFSKIVSNILQLIFIIRYKSFVLFIFAFLIENIIQHLLFRRYFKRKYVYFEKTNQKEIKIFKDMKNLFWHKVSGIVVFNTDYIIISKFISIEIVAIYSSYLVVYNFLLMLVNSISNVVSPRVGQKIKLNSIEENFILWRKLNILFFYLALVLTLTTCKLINKFIFLWMGKEYLLNNEIVILLSLNFFINVFRIGNDIFKNNSGYFSDIHLPILEALMNLFLSIIFVRHFGLSGVVLGTVASNFIIILIAKPIFVFKNCFNKNSNEYFKLFFKLSFFGLISLFLLKIDINFSINYNIYFRWFLEATVYFICFMFLLFLLLLSSLDFRGIIKDIFGIDKKNLYSVKNKKEVK